MKKRGAATIEAFLDMMSAERGASPNTVDAYRRDLVAFEEWLTKSDARDATRDDVKAYIAHLSRAQIAESSQARKLSTLRQYYGFLYGEGFRKDDPTSAVDSPRRVQALPK